MSDPVWDVLVRYLYLRAQRYDRDGGHQHPRYRIEVVDPPSSNVRGHLLQMEANCVHCHRKITPVRQRRSQGPARGSLYLAVTCPLSDRYACARSSAAAKEYERIVAAVKGWSDPCQPRLWGA